MIRLNPLDPVERRAPAGFGLMRQARDQVDVDPANPVPPEETDLVGDLFGRVLAARRGRLLGHERLHAQANAGDSQAGPAGRQISGDGAGACLDRRLTPAPDGETAQDRLQVLGLHQAWRATA